MTRQEITALCKDTLGEFLGAPGSDDPFAWDRLIDTAAADVCRATECLSLTVGADIAANQAVYCLPQLLRITGVFYEGADRQIRQLTECAPQDLDYRFCGWRGDPPSTPRFILPTGLNAFRLYPTPDTSSAIYSYADLVLQTDPTGVASTARPFVAGDAGSVLRITGGTGFTGGAYTIESVSAGVATLDRPAGTGGSTQGLAVLTTGGLSIEGIGVATNAMWPNPTDECPIVERGQMAVIYRACLLRIIQKPTAENAARRPMLQAEYDQAKGKLGREVRQYSQATNHADQQRLNNRMQW